MDLLDAFTATLACIAAVAALMYPIVPRGRDDPTKPDAQTDAPNSLDPAGNAPAGDQLPHQHQQQR